MAQTNTAKMGFPPQMYRLHESPLVFDTVWHTGEPVDQRFYYISIDLEHSFECLAVGWDILARSRADIDDLMWWGHLTWHLVNTNISIAHLSALYGQSMGPTQSAKSVYEQLADISPDDFRQDCFQPGEMSLYRGMVKYEKPLVLPANTRPRVSLSLDSHAFKARDELRLRLTFYGTHKRVIPMG